MSAAAPAVEYTSAELAAIKSEYAKGATEEQFLNFMRECRTRNLIPGKHVYFQVRNASEWDADTRSKVRVKRATHQTSIDAFRLIAQRSGEYEGQEPFTYIYLDDDNKPTTRSTIPLPEGDSTEDPKMPWAVEAAVYRKYFKKATTAVARFEAYAVTYKKNDKEVLSEMWKRRGPEQLAKCAEALALRQAFPEELGGLYITEELRDEPDEQPTATPAAETAAPKTVTAPAVDNKPAEGTNEPRPGEKKARKKSDKVDKENPKVDKKEDKVLNPHGIDITDDDLPENLRPGYVPAEADKEAAKSTGEPSEPEEFAEPEPKKEAAKKADSKDDRAPTAEEKSAISGKLKAFKQDSALLRAFILNFTNEEDTKKLSLAQWNKVIDHLDTASKAGTLNKVVGGAA